MKEKLANFLGGKNSFSAASIILIITLFLSNILGLIRDHFLTQKIPTDILSSYYAAFRIPDLIFNVLILGAISSAFIPIFSSLITHKRNEEAWRVTNSIINIGIIVLIVSCLILAVFIPQIMPLFVPGFTPEKQQLTIKLARIMLASPVFFGLSYIFGAVLNSFKRFVVYSFAPLVYNLSIIGGTIFFADRAGVTGVAIAVVLGAFLHMLIQVPVAMRLGFRWRAFLDYKNSYVKRIGVLMFPRAIGLAANQIMLLIFTAIASSLGGAAVAIYNLADNIQTMPMVVFGTSFALAIFPTLSESAAKNDTQGFNNYFLRSLRSVVFFIIPIIFILIMLRAQIVRLILGSGFFGWGQTVDTANTLAFFAVSLVFTSVVPLLARSFYALHNTKIPMIVTVITIIISVVSAYIFTPKYQIGGLAIAFSIGAFFNAMILYVLLQRRMKFNQKPIIFFVLKVIAASVITAIALQEAKFIVAIFVDMQRFWGVLTQTVVALFVSVLIYLLLSWIFGIDEISSIKIILRKITGRSLVQEDATRGGE